jgi:hypothetical protein
VAAARRAGARVVRADRGRARQLNAGARAARGPWLLFLHADSRLPAAARRALLAAVVDRPDLDAAVFRFALDLPGFWGRFVEFGQALRQRLLALPYGDQGLLIRRTLFESLGGYADIPVMEDVELVRRARHRASLSVLPAPLVTSGRRYAARGPLRTWLEHSALLALYFLGVAPARLARWRAQGA